MNSVIKSLSNHERGRKERFMINHSADVIIENYDESEKEEVVSQVSAKSGYHPYGYGLYGVSKISPTDNKDEYKIVWKTGDNCD